MHRASCCVILPLLLVCGSSGLAQVSSAQLSAYSAPNARPAIPVAFSDSRPKWERRSRKCAVEFRALEDCQPPPWGLLRDAIQQQAGSWPQPPSRARVVLSSFRLVIKKEVSGSGDGESGLWVPPISSSGRGNGAAAVGAVAVVAAVVAVEAGFIVTKALVQEGVRCERDWRGPPYNLYKEYSSGVTCDIKARVILEWQDGKNHEWNLSAVVNGGPDVEHTTESRLCDIQETVRRATEVLVDDWTKNAK
jgi:hypothetical protein